MNQRRLDSGANPPDCDKPEELFQVNTEDEMAAYRRISLFPGVVETTRKIIILQTRVGQTECWNWSQPAWIAPAVAGAVV